MQTLFDLMFIITFDGRKAKIAKRILEYLLYIIRNGIDVILEFDDRISASLETGRLKSLKYKTRESTFSYLSSAAVTDVIKGVGLVGGKV